MTVARRLSINRAVKACLLGLSLWVGSASGVCAHAISMPPPLNQPESPVQLKSCYLGTDFMFEDPKLASEQTKMQLSADLLRPVPPQYTLLGLRFEFGLDGGKRSSDVVVFTTSQTSNDRNVMAAPPGLDPSGYLPRVPDYDDYHCGVDFATSLDWHSSWFDTGSDVVPCKAPANIPESSAVWLMALELLPAGSNAVFSITSEKQRGVFWSLDDAPPQFAKSDDFRRSVVDLGRLSRRNHTLIYGSAAAKLDQQICFRPSPER